MSAFAYYNELDENAVAWLRELIARGAIADGVVDSRPIQDVDPDDLDGFTQCHFFAGIGVWSYALRLAGWPDDRPVWTGSCPCQPFSVSGRKQGFADDRHLWPYWIGHIALKRPPVVFGEQVASPDGLHWLDAVLADLEAQDYAAGASDLCAAGIGAPHIRQRLYFVAHPVGTRLEGHSRDGDHGDEPRWERADAAGSVAESGVSCYWHAADWLLCRDGRWRPVEPGTFPLAHGAAARVGRLRGYGNAIVAQVAATFIRAYLEARGGVT